MSSRLLAGLVVAGLAVYGTVIAVGRSEVRRPEGAIERFLHAVSDRNAGQTVRWGRPQVADALARLSPVNNPRFSTIETGRATLRGDLAHVPVRVVTNDGPATDHFLTMTARRAASSPHRWRAVAARVVPVAATPSRGGDRPARAHLLVWPAATFAVFTLGAGADRLIARMRRNAAVRGR